VSLAQLSKKWVGTTTSAVLIGSLLALAAPSLVSSAGPCAGDGPDFAGWTSSNALTGHEPEGVKASLTYRDGDGCSAAAGGAKGRGAWVMIAGNNTSVKYAQSGFWMFGNAFDCWHHFAEYNNGGSPVAQEGPCTNLNEVHVPAVKYIAATGKTEMWVDNLRILIMSICSCNWAHPLVLQLFGETSDRQSDVPGLAATKTDWNSIQLQYYSDDTWHGSCLPGGIKLYKSVTLARYAADAPACNHTRSWTATP
jgi:hypothetical protein